MLKMVSKKIQPFEVEIVRFFSVEDDPRNHRLPLLDVLQDPDDEDLQIMVIHRMIDMRLPRFNTVGEVVDCFCQIFEGLEFMHEHHAAHHDCYRLNIVMDPEKMFPQGFHLAKTRTDRCLRLSLWAPTKVRRNMSACERSLGRTDRECNPFPTDVYYAGNLIGHYFARSHTGIPEARIFFTHVSTLLATLTIDGPQDGIENHWPLRFLKPLVAAMTHDDPADDEGGRLAL
ncbi:hypothetical protein B0H14DRAFT_3889995 [Mycena olivaceomarginata]|nr:hypothetical protein B0H14DRAFT_3889995 [Mycena olivaceomarginata]